MATTFSEDEKRILNYLSKDTQVVYQGKEYTVVKSGKPTCDKGEPKTDIYCCLKNNDEIEEIKISYKKTNADFLENKISAERAKQILGEAWKDIIKKSTIQISKKFEEKPRIYKREKGKTQKGSFTLGWKFELVNKENGDLSGKLELTHKQLCDIYAGNNLSEEKRNAEINKEKINNSGVANYILVSDDINSGQDVIDQMQSIEDYAKEHMSIFFACKALNYRSYKKKYDGNRPLAVQVKWYIKDGKLASQLVFDKPLELNGTEIKEMLGECLEKLNIETAEDICKKNSDMSYVYEGKNNNESD